MNLTQFQLYRFDLTDNEGSELRIYVVASNWPRAFNTVYEKFGDEININLVEKLANENIGLFVSDEYSISRQPIDTTILKGMNIYDKF